MSLKSYGYRLINSGIISEITAENSEINSGIGKNYGRIITITISAYNCRDGNDPDWVKALASKNHLSRIAGEDGRSVATAG